MIGFEWVAAKFFWYLFFMYFTLLYFTFHGMMATGLTPNETVASIVSSTIYNAWNLFSGYLIPRPVTLPSYVIFIVITCWFRNLNMSFFCYTLHIQNPYFVRKFLFGGAGFWICPVAWTLYGLVASQYGDIQTNIDGRDQTAAQFVTEYFGFHRDLLWVVALVHIVFTVAFAFMFSFAIMKFNFQRR